MNKLKKETKFRVETLDITTSKAMNGIKTLISTWKYPKAVLIQINSQMPIQLSEKDAEALARFILEKQT